MPERDAVRCNLGDGYGLAAAGLQREKSGNLTADLILENGRVLYADRGVLNTPEGRLAWATKAQTPDGPTAERMAEALREHVLTEALAILQEPAAKPTQADKVVDLAGDLTADLAAALHLFHDPGGTAYATFPVRGHRETAPLATKRSRQWLARRYYEQYGQTPGGQALADALAVLSGQALFDGPELEVHVRVASHAGAIYIDLGDDAWRAIEVDRDGWRIVAEPPVKFRRSQGMLPLPEPQLGGDLTELRPFLNVGDDDDAGGGDETRRFTGDDRWMLAVAWLVGAFRPRGPYPLLIILGGHGRAKTTTQRVLRLLVDPNTADVRALPRDARDLMISASNSWVGCYDNVSSLPDWTSDALCRLATGAGFATRSLYTDLDETIISAQRPVMANGITEFAERADLIDRALFITPPEITAGSYRPERDFWAEFEEARPRILGAVLDVVATALAREATVAVADVPRMADFTTWIVAAEPALLWKPGAFLAAYAANRAAANDMTLEASPAAQALRAFMQDRPEWLGTMTALLSELEHTAGEKATKQAAWPKNAKALSDRLRQVAANLEAVGVRLSFGHKIGKQRAVRIERTATAGSTQPPGTGKIE